VAKILVVDDQADNRELVVTLITYRGHQPLEAADGAEALALVRSERPQLVISDILMPTMDGYEFVRQLRAEPAIAGTEVIFYSAHYLEREARSLATECGVSHVLIKPCEPQDILDAIDQALSHVPAPVVVREVPDVPEFDREHLRLLTNKLSEKVADLEAVNRRLDALTDFNLQLASERDPLQLLEKVCRGARDLVGATYAVVCVTSKVNSELVYFTSGINSTLADRLEAPDIDRGPLGATRAERRSRRMTIAKGDVTAAGLPSGYPPLHACLMAPVMSLNFAYGWIFLADKLGAKAFSDEDERILSILAAQVGRIYENGVLYAEVQRYAGQLQLEIKERKRATEELRTSEAGLHHAQLLAKLTHVITGPDGAFESWPETMPQLIGLDASRMITSTVEWLKMVHPEDRAMYLDKVVEVGATGIRTDFEYRLRRTDGIWLQIRQVMEPLPGATEPSSHERWFNTMQDVSEQKRAQEALHESDRRFRDMLANVQMVSLMLDRDARITYCNDYMLRLTGWTSEEVIGRNWFEIFIPAEFEDVKKTFSALLANRPSAWHFENEILTRAGARRLIRWNNTVLRSASGEISGTASIGEDVTDSRVAETKIRRLNRVYAVLSDINTLIVRVHNRDELFREACRIAVEHGQFRMAWIGLADREAMKILPIASAGVDPEFLAYIKENFSLNEDDPLGHTRGARAIRARKPVVSNNLQAETDSLFVAERIQTGIAAMAFLPLIVANEAVGVLALYADEQGFFVEEEMKLLTELASDIGFALDHIEKEERLNYLAYYDELTNLPNRMVFLERISQLLRTRAGETLTMALVLVDIDRFQVINETFDRQAGDELLRLVAQRMQRSAIGFDTVASVGVNCYGIVIRDPRDAEAVAHIVEQLLNDCFAKPFRLRDTDLRIAGKAGIALYPLDGDDAEKLYRNAEAALKRARGAVELLVFYAPAMNARVAEALSLESKLRTALELGQFLLYYQPKINLTTGRITSVEALLRWHDPQSGLMQPAQFIPILEETGLIYEVGRWAIRQALDDYLRWRAAGLHCVRIAVNVSPLQLRHRSFIGDVRRAIGIDAQAAQGLELEITESLIMEDVNHTITSLHEIRAMGITVAIDDFGTGFSSLSYLARLPVDTLKIDRSFIIDMTAGPQGLALVSTIISLAHALKLKVVAEGVETEEQARLLRLLNCDEMQGYLFSRPVPGGVLEASHLASPPQ
jgi:diguanylate cyclase (GGDEF)-like protein/PAS domain S-box-containing protein